MKKGEIQLIFEYDKWADLKLFEVIAALTGDQYKKILIQALAVFKEHLYIYYLPTKSG